MAEISGAAAIPHTDQIHFVTLIIKRLPQYVNF